MDELELRRLVDEGATLRELANTFGVHVDTVRRRLRQCGLLTGRMATIEDNRSARAAGASELLRKCPIHGKERFERDGKGSYRCRRCRADAVARRRRRMKKILAIEAGGACVACGYSRCLPALNFHHVDRATKSFNLAYKGPRVLLPARIEVWKCVLLCANCHMEVEAGYRRLS